jgi:hypothetical protein
MQAQRRERFTARMFPSSPRARVFEVRRGSGWDCYGQSQWQARRKRLDPYFRAGQIIAQTEAFNFAMAGLARRTRGNLGLLVAQATDGRHRVVGIVRAVQRAQAATAKHRLEQEAHDHQNG